MLKYEEFVHNTANNMYRISPELGREIMMVYSLGREIESGKYHKNNIDLSDKLAKQRYNETIDEIIAAKPKEYFIKDFKSMDKSLVLNGAFEILVHILGYSEQLLNTYYEFISNIEVNRGNSNNLSPMNGYSIEIVNTNNNTKKHNILIPSVSSVSSIVSILHEFAHFYFQKNNIEYKKIYYREILSILFEKIAADIVENNLKDSKFSNKIENIRLDCIKFHYTDKKEDVAQYKMMANESKGVYRDYMKKLSDEYTSYCNNIAESYGLGYIYAENLYYLYKNEPLEFYKKMQEIFKKRTTLEDTLNYYNIKASNKDVFERAKQRIRTIR